ncbi:MAG: hypothetical protein JSW60_09530, partial [Thermoplasmatales archaeon]
GCGNDEWSDPLTIHIILNSPPNTPVIEGPEEVWVGVEYTFYITFEDPDGDQWFLWVDWGDGNTSGWLGPYNSGETASYTHYWTETGTYVIRIKAKDIFGEESGWSEFIIRVIPPPRFFRHMKISGMLKTRPWRGLIFSVIDFDYATVTEGISGNVQLEPFTCHNYKFVALALKVHFYNKETQYINASAPFMILIGY